MCSLLPAVFSDSVLLPGRLAWTDRCARSDWRSLTDFLASESLLDCNSLGEALQGVLTLKLFKLDGRVLVEELVEGKIASSYTDIDLILVNFDVDLLGAELVDTLRLPHEHNLKFLAVGVVVYVLG